MRVYHLDLWAGTIRVDCEATGEGHSGTNGIRRVIRDMTGADKEPSPDLDVPLASLCQEIGTGTTASNSSGHSVPVNSS